MKEKKFIILTGFFFLVFVLGVGVLTLEQPLSRFLRASNVTPPSPKKSIILVTSPSRVAVNNPVNILVTVRGEDTKVLPAGRRVRLFAYMNGDPNPSTVTITPNKAVSDQPNTGETEDVGAKFTITSSATGIVTLRVTDITDKEINLGNNPTVEFVSE